jgi:hypothetical protein
MNQTIYHHGLLNNPEKESGFSCQIGIKKEEDCHYIILRKSELNQYFT